MDIRNENFKAKALSKLLSKAPAIVNPDLDIAGRIAIPCATPTSAASGYETVFISFFLLLSTLSASHRIRPVAIKHIPRYDPVMNAFFIKSLNTTAIITVGTVATATRAVILENGFLTM